MAEISSTCETMCLSIKSFIQFEQYLHQRARKPKQKIFKVETQ